MQVADKLNQFKQRYVRHVTEGKAPLENCSFLNRLFFAWLNPLLKIGSGMPLEFEMMPEIPAKYKHERVSNRMRFHFQNCLDEFLRSGKQSERMFILRVVLRCFKWDIFFAVVIVLALTLFEYSSSYFLQKILQIKSEYSTGEQLSAFVILSICLIASKLIFAIGSENAYYFLVGSLGYSWHSVLFCLVGKCT